ncbi:DUF397 domain-containing protein [Streptomyces chromofuscus]|uniref:DUF397 domain-containing protein n=1 Tax=Streptomyces chromofuscus TaxID=42881 RepID=A0A7M2TG40_STRCW|nr:DUF397 domain-containing protein [Streptomyces chromofuscus]QOV47164.1 DUF397 domain-containing protein [Streptomyces chromofuscus]GGT37542.1 hypothetical protein GCM10010254_67030 [Streptomyces chromofuscus]
MSTPQLHWCKSSYSSSSEPGDCVEVAATSATVHVRDSKTPDAAHLTVTPTAWARFLTHLPGR